MSDYAVGYGKPPPASRFKPGKSGNPKGRPKRQPLGLANIIDRVLGAPITYREKGRAKSATRHELALKMLIANAMKGDIGAADHILMLYGHARRFGDPSDTWIEIENWLPDRGGQTADQKAQQFAATQTADRPIEWWDDPGRSQRPSK